ncbi:fMet-Leu-Phe receptor [Biomphalaria glabrata]|nr:fMet-Leu-Phe receptor [Biomphalaria glabrata]
MLKEISPEDSNNVQLIDDVTSDKCLNTSSNTYTNIANNVTQLFISDQDIAKLFLVFCTLCGVIGLTGCLGNAITMATYLSMKLKDGVMISFFGLAVSDFLYDVTMLAIVVSDGLYMLERKSSFKTWFLVEPFGVYVFCSNIGVMIYLVTILITTFIAIIRCLCVSMPLQFRNLLTRRRSVWCIAIFSLVSVVSYVPILLNMTMQESFDMSINSTRYRLKISPYREEIKTAIWISRDLLVTLITEVIVIVCVVIMIKNLQTATKFRNKSVNYSIHPTLPCVAVFGIENKSDSTQIINTLEPNTKHINIQSNKMSTKDVSVVQQVVLISSIYIVCNMPKILINMALFFVPDLALEKPYQNVYLTVVGIMELFQAFNSSFNICVYLKFNSKFRKHLCIFNKQKCFHFVNI